MRFGNLFDSERVHDFVQRYGESVVRAQLRAIGSSAGDLETPDEWLSLALRHDTEPRAVSVRNKCVCGSGRTRHLSYFIYWNLLGQRQCEDCRTVFVSPRLTASEMRQIFEVHYFRNQTPDFWGRRRRRVFSEVCTLLKTAGATCVLDVGTGYGHFVDYLRQQGLTATGCDISTKTVSRGRRLLDVEIHACEPSEAARRAPRRVDAVTCLDTLYYDDDPKSSLESFRNLLPDGGTLILRVRNGWHASVRARAPRLGRPVGTSLLPQPHLYGFTVDALRDLLQKTGFGVIRFTPSGPSREPDPLHRLGSRVLDISSHLLGIMMSHSIHVLATAV